MAPVEVQDLPPEKPTALPTEAKEADESAKEVKAIPQPVGPQNFEDYNRPLLFAPEDNKVQITSPQVRWDLTGGSQINLGGLLFSSAGIKMVVDQNDRDGVPSRYLNEGSGPKVTNISFAWPSFMVRTGELTIESLQGKIVWTKDINEDLREEWTQIFTRDPDDLRIKTHGKSTWGILDIDLVKYPFMANGSKFRFCFSKSVSEAENIRICSNPYMVSITGDLVRLLAGTDKSKASVFIGKEEIGPNARVNFPPGKKISIRVQFANGSFVQLTSKPLEVKFLDVVESKDGKSIVLTGRGAKPIGKVEDVEVPPNHFWSATGQLKEIVWRINVARELPLLRVFGAWNVPFTYLIRYDALPHENDRVYIHKRTGSGTYVDGAWIRTYAPRAASISSKEKRVLKKGGNLYRWDFAAKKKGEANDSRLIIKEPGAAGKTWIAHYELFRGKSYEFSARLTGILDPTFKTAISGEIAAAKWFERIAGIESYGFSERRWGITARYFQALSGYSALAPDDPEPYPFSTLNTELRYNLIPGIWNRDELFGLIAGYEAIELANLKGTYYGAGVYWARTMPKIFDDLFNILPFLRYPKYVDMDFVFYGIPADASTQQSVAVNPTQAFNFNLNFHGKVFWRSGWYGEAGFGFRQLGVGDTVLGTFSGKTFYGTAGLGLVF